jgi:flavodoxin
VILAKVLVVYESKWGNTKSVAEAIIEGIQKFPGMETSINKRDDVKRDRIDDFDALVIGSPNHMGGATVNMKKFISKLGTLSIEGKCIAFFDTYLGKDYEKAVKKMEKQAADKLPGIELITPGLSIRVEGLKGPIAEGELPKCVEFGSKIAARLRG